MPTDPRAAVLDRLRQLDAAAGFQTVDVYRGELRAAARGALTLTARLPAAYVLASRARLGTSADALARLDVRVLVLVEDRALSTEAAEADAYALARALALEVVEAPVWSDAETAYAVQTDDEGTAADVRLLLSVDGLAAYAVELEVVQSAG